MTISTMRSPKRKAGSKDSRSSLFRYYAGFSDGFVEDTLAHLGLDPDAILLDPWLGAGTTSEVVLSNGGYQFRGYDINPAMLFVARARTLPTELKGEVLKTAQVLIKMCDRELDKTHDTEFEPLEQWLQPASSHRVRAFERSIARATSTQSNDAWKNASKIGSIGAFLYVALFRTVRSFMNEFQSSNPTWMKISQGSRRLYIPTNRLTNRFLTEIEEMLAAVNSEARAMPSVGRRKCVIRCASSLNLPLSANSVDAVLSSPPYCTRIDYVQATLPELAVLRFPDGKALRRLRESMIGEAYQIEGRHKKLEEYSEYFKSKKKIKGD